MTFFLQQDCSFYARTNFSLTERNSHSVKPQRGGGQSGRWAYKENPGFASSLCSVCRQQKLSAWGQGREVKRNSREIHSSGFTLVKLREKLYSQLCEKINNFLKYWLNVKSRFWVHGHVFNMLNLQQMDNSWRKSYGFHLLTISPRSGTLCWTYTEVRMGA